TSGGDARPGPVLKQCVGIVVDVARGHFYWTQKGPENGGVGKIFRAGIDMPAGETAATRRDVTTVVDGLPEPVDLEIDEEHRMLYWTDRGDAPAGNTVNRMPLDTVAKHEVVLRHLGEGIGITLDVRHDRMFVTDLAGSVHAARLDGSGAREIAAGQ